MRRPLPVWIGLCALAATPAATADGPTTSIGVATVDITPGTPIRLVGYASRKGESDGIESRLKAKAIAIGADPAVPAVMIAVDTLGVPAAIADEVAARLLAKAGLPRDRLAICSTHTHCAPAVGSALDIMFAGPLPADQRAHIDAYTRDLTDALERVAIEAMAARKPGRLSWSQGSVGFAANRRVIKNGKWTGFGVTPDGPVDRSLPVLRATDLDGKTRAVVVGYACHCTTLGGDFNKVCGEWAGYAADDVERANPGATAMVVIGCGGDANPEPRLKLDDAKAHGRAIATEVARLLAAPMAALPGAIAGSYRKIELPFGTPPTRAELAKRVSLPGPDGYFARVMLAKVEAGEALPRSVAYPIQTWAFGDAMAMVFLGGEVVVDYSLRIKRECAPGRLWVVAYANDVPCYIASRRMIAEGGYEVDASMIYYGRPTRLAPEVEDKIIATVHDLLPDVFDLKK